MGGFGTSWWQGPPAPPTEDQARAVLAGWARRTRLVPNTLFDGRMVVACATCGGRALVRCPKTVACEACGGTGRLFPRQGPPETCPTCRGFKKVTCEACKGIGKRPCTSCTGGQVSCPTCGATGFLTGYQEGRIQRTIDHTTVKAGAGKAIVRPADVDLYQLVPTGEQAPDLSLLPVPAQAELTVELARLVPGERRRKVQLLALPVVAVTYHDDGPRTAYLLGRERRVRAPGARRLGRLFRFR